MKDNNKYTSHVPINYMKYEKVDKCKSSINKTYS